LSNNYRLDDSAEFLWEDPIPKADQDPAGPKCVTDPGDLEHWLVVTRIQKAARVFIKKSPKPWYPFKTIFLKAAGVDNYKIYSFMFRAAFGNPFN
jgi:hypothetical protein